MTIYGASFGMFSAPRISRRVSRRNEKRAKARRAPYRRGLGWCELFSGIWIERLGSQATFGSHFKVSGCAAAGSKGDREIPGRAGGQVAVAERLLPVADDIVRGVVSRHDDLDVDGCLVAGVPRFADDAELQAVGAALLADDLKLGVSPA